VIKQTQTNDDTEMKGNMMIHCGIKII